MNKIKNDEINKEKGITLIALVITIIVLLILAGVTIQTLTGDNGLLGKTSESKFITEIQHYNEELKLAITEDYTNSMGNRQNKFNVRRSSYNDENSFTNAMKTKIPSFNSKYVNKLEIKEDKLNYIGEDEQERAWLAQAISVAGMLKINYVYENGTEAAPTYQRVIADGSYEVESPIIDGYEPDQYIVSGEIEGDKNITVTYYPPSQGLEYELLDDGTYTVAGIGTFTGNTLVIPAKHEEKDITQIKANAFKSNKNIKNLNIADSIKQINSNAFRNSNIETLILGKKIDNIDPWSFGGCTNLKTITIKTTDIKFNASHFQADSNFTEIKLVGNSDKYKVEDNILYSKDGKTLILCPTGRKGEFTIPNDVEVINNSAFQGSYLKSVIITDNVKEVGISALRSASIENLIIGKNVENIENWAFGGCGKLKNVTIRTKDIKFNASIFQSNPCFTQIQLEENNDKYRVEDNILYSKDSKELILCPTGKTGNLTIPNTVKIIKESAFMGCSLTSITISDSIQKIENSAFRNSNIETITIGKNVENIGSWGIGGCTKLKTVIIDSPIAAANNLGMLLENRDIIYVNKEITNISDYIRTNYDLSTSDKEDYNKYIKN